MLDMPASEQFGFCPRNFSLSDDTHSSVWMSALLNDDRFKASRVKLFDAWGSKVHDVAHSFRTVQAHPKSVRKYTEYFRISNTAGDYDKELFDFAQRILIRELQEGLAFVGETGPMPMDDFDKIFVDDTKAGGFGCPDKKRDCGAIEPFARAYYREPWNYEYPIWTLAPKGNEALPMSKLNDFSMRGICYPPVWHLMLEKGVCGPLDDFLGMGVMSWCAYGFTPFRGGFHHLLEPLSVYPYKFKDDIKKMDVHYTSVIWDGIKRVRKALMKPSTHRHIDEVYNRKIDALVWLSDGSIIRTENQQKSGAGSTTPDNCLAHRLVYLYSCLRFLRDKKPEEWQLVSTLPLNDVPYALQRYFDIRLYSDDHVGATVFPEFAQLGHRAESYRQLGFTLKPEEGEHKDSENLGDLSFCGAFPVSVNGTIQPAFDPERMIGKLFAKEYDPTSPEFEATCLSCAVLLRHTPMWDYAWTLYREVCQARDSVPVLESDVDDLFRDPRNESFASSASKTLKDRVFRFFDSDPTENPVQIQAWHQFLERSASQNGFTRSLRTPSAQAQRV